MSRLLLLSLLLVPAAAHAQRARPFAEQGDVALVVGVSGLTDLDLSPALGGIGVRYRATDRSVIGTSIGFDVGTTDRDDSGDSQSTGGVQVAVWNENHIGRGRGIVSPFVGGGVVAGFRRQSYTTGIDPCEPFGCPIPPCDPAACPGVPEAASQSQTRVSVGVGAILGAEVRVARGVTLGAAYTLGVAVERVSYDSDLPFGSDDTGSTTVLGGTGLTDLHLSVYF